LAGGGSGRKSPDRLSGEPRDGFTHISPARRIFSNVLNFCRSASKKMPRPIPAAGLEEGVVAFNAGQSVNFEFSDPMTLTYLDPNGNIVPNLVLYGSSLNGVISQEPGMLSLPQCVGPARKA
jgi:hypothetical protein